jgi:hypothetical protein
MKSKTTAILLLYFIVIIFCGFNSFKSKLNIQEKIIDTTALSLCQDSLKLLDDWKIDYGFNNGITFWGDTTYNLYKSKVKWQPGVAMQVLELKSANSFIFIKFTSNHEIERVNYTGQTIIRIKYFIQKIIINLITLGLKLEIAYPLCLKNLKEWIIRWKKITHRKKTFVLIYMGL